MAYQISPDIEARVQAHLASGEFLNADAVLREALDALERRQQSLRRLQEMVKEAEEDVAAGRVGVFDAEATMRAVMTRVEAARSQVSR
jgi:putative addiction module CopG family antidote